MEGKKLVLIITALVIVMAIIIFILVSNFEPGGMDPEESAIGLLPLSKFIALGM
ncbi:hypothetical protein P6709_14155 [Jeotgalibacillus sp. ET6]|uniref:hypothetical protein n=1 Tax=Jeotgalibacillus sp. ET6 TaxID=3037260 RepID=UPI002418A59B|nr:hypothetical protein [Jeotgalibacillus sp. ET6]MDG5472892.1 hypothetical protein [Jeotgalibacillus sp. ET6]